MTIVETKGHHGFPTYHIFDNDGREIALNRYDLEQLAHLIKDTLGGVKK